MSHKTLDEINRRDHLPPKRLFNLWPVPETTYQQNDDERAQLLINGKLSRPEPVVRAYQRSWDPGHHLASAGEQFTDALWGINEGKRDVTDY